MVIEEVERQTEELHRQTYPDGQEDKGIQEKVPTPLDAPSVEDEEKASVKYQVLKGKYVAEVPRLLTTVSEQTQLIKDLQSKLDEKANTASNGDPAVEDDDIQWLSTEHPTVFNAVKKLIKADTEGEIKKVKDSVDIMKQTNIDTTLTAKIPNWREMNADPAFISSLTSKIPLTTMTKLEALNNAYHSGDIDTVVEIFNGYTKESTPTKPDIRDEIGLGSKASGGEVSPLNNKQSFTTTEIRQFYKDVALGIYKGQNDKIVKMEAQYNLAAREGRISGK